jgi:glutathione S-transferase
MFKLCGFSASNYYNVVKLALLEKGVSFEEELAWLGETDSTASPLGKVPYVLTDDGPLSESTVILEYIEACYPQRPLLPAHPYQAAKARELARYIELHLELVARNLYPEAFFGGKVSDSLKAAIRPQLEKGAAGLAGRVKFAPFIAGAEFTLADCAAVVHLPLVSSASKIIYGDDVLAQLPLRDYHKRLGERPSVQKVHADRRACTEQFMARMKQVKSH